MSSLIPIALMVSAMIATHLGNGVAMELFPVVGTWSVAAARMFFAGVILWAFTRPKVWTWTRSQWFAAIGMGLSTSVMMGTYYASIDLIPVGTAVTLLFLGPLALGAVMSRSARDFAGVGLAVIALGFIALDSFNGTSLHPVGVMVALVSAAAWFVFILVSKRATELIPGLGSLAVSFIVGGLSLLPMARGNVVPFLLDPQIFLQGLLVALVSSLIPFCLNFIALRRIPANMYAVLTSLEPAVAAIIAWFMLAQFVTPLKAVGIALVIAASAVQSISPPPSIQRRLTTVARVGRERTRKAGRSAKARGAWVVHEIATHLPHLPHIPHVALLPHLPKPHLSKPHLPRIPRKKKAHEGSHDRSE